MGNRPGSKLSHANYQHLLPKLTRFSSAAPGASVYRSAISTIVQQSQETVTLTFKEAIEPRVLDVRPPCRVRRPGAPRFRSMPSPSAAAGGEASATSRDDASGRRTPGAASLSPLSIGAGGGSGRASPRIEPGGASQHPFDDPLFASGLMAAGYSEMIDISRKKIKTRFSHGLGKEHVSTASSLRSAFG